MASPKKMRAQEILDQVMDLAEEFDIDINDVDFSNNAWSLKQARTYSNARRRLLRLVTAAFKD